MCWYVEGTKAVPTPVTNVGKLDISLESATLRIICMTVIEDIIVAGDMTVAEDTTVVEDTTVAEGTTAAEDTTTTEDTTVAEEEVVIVDVVVIEAAVEAIIMVPDQVVSVLSVAISYCCIFRLLRFLEVGF